MAMRIGRAERDETRGEVDVQALRQQLARRFGRTVVDVGGAVGEAGGAGRGEGGVEGEGAREGEAVGVAGGRREVLDAGLTALGGVLPWGGWPRGCVAEIVGVGASGRTRVAVAAVAAATRREGGLAAWLDVRGELHPPAAVAWGVRLDRLLLVRRPARARGVRLMGLLVQSHLFDVVVVDGLMCGGRMDEYAWSVGQRVAADARRSGAVVLVLSEEEGMLPVAMRLRTEAAERGKVRVHLVRSRMGWGAKRETVLPFEMETTDVRRETPRAAGVVGGDHVPLREGTAVAAVERIRPPRRVGRHRAGGPPWMTLTS